MPLLLRWTILLLALAPFAYSLLVLYAARRFFASRPPLPPADFTPPVSVLKPVYGLDREAFENFASFCRQDYPEYEILFAVTEERDPAVPVIRRLIREFPHRSIRLLVGAPRLGANDKVNKLARLAREARYDLLAISDSDMRVEPRYLAAVAGELRDPAVGLVTCPYRGDAGRSLGSRLEAIGISTGFAPDVLAAWLLEGVNFALGATMAVRRSVLGEIGGFEALADFYADDYELGHRVAARRRVELCRWPVVTVLPEESLRESYRHQVRWAAVIRSARPAGHVGLVFTFALPWTIAAMVASPSLAVAAAYLAAYLGLRAAVAWVVGVRGLGDTQFGRRCWMVPLRDAFAFLVWLSSFIPQPLHWRGDVYYVRRGRLVPASRGPQ